MPVSCARVRGLCLCVSLSPALSALSSATEPPHSTAYKMHGISAAPNAGTPWMRALLTLCTSPMCVRVRPNEQNDFIFE